MSIPLTPERRATLEAAVSVFVHASGDAGAAHLQATTDTVLGMLNGTSVGEQKEFAQLLDLLHSKLPGLLWAGRLRRFADLTPEDRSRLLQKWSRSRLGTLRKAFQSLKKLSLFAHYGIDGPASLSEWKVIGYPGPNPSTPAGPPERIQLTTPRDGEQMDCDVVVVGSGAGGGIAAGILAEAGYAVIVLEKGPYLEGAEFNQHEVERIRSSYEKQGAMTSQDGGVGIFAGSCLGGGTTINWTACFETPDYVRGEWAKEAGLGFALEGAYEHHMASVMASISANKAHSTRNPQNELLWKSIEKLGREPGLIARNVQGCGGEGHADCGYCGLGCRSGTKQSTLRTWLRRAADKGARILAHTHAERILQTNGKASGVDAVYQSPGEAPRNFTIRAKRVVVAAGALHSPALLLRSGLDHPGIGRNLFFHPTVVVAGFYKEQMDPWLGPMMTTVDWGGTRLDGNYGHWIETPPVHAGMAALALPWENAGQHRRDMERVRNMASFIVLTRDKFGGRVRVDRQGQPVVDYQLHPYDRQHMLHGLRTTFDLHRAAGAQEVVFPHFRHNRYKIATAKMSAESYLAGMPGWGWGANRFAMFTAHQMGTCGMGSDPAQHPFNPQGECYALPGLFIADGSALPTCAGVNPMVSIMSLAGWVAKGMV